ncbi:hypothetical protein Pcinc_039179 [Petrolisthes cinctipes]|uniref:Uncharacterized protein n=1 Tax=Petrolisthes cinctipes TaxID=88211 RepID=A0AAE1BP12_PETCI|nr:hypothetical protein Pcinc_039179 [Petrolisthes cinctipes]
MGFTNTGTMGFTNTGTLAFTHTNTGTMGFTNTGTMGFTNTGTMAFTHTNTGTMGFTNTGTMGFTHTNPTTSTMTRGNLIWRRQLYLQQGATASTLGHKSVQLEGRSLSHVERGKVNVDRMGLCSVTVMGISTGYRRR